MTFDVILAGIISGLVSSIFIWMLLTHICVPRLRISDKIAKSPATHNKNKVKYQFAVINLGLRRAHDIKFKVFLSVKNITGKAEGIRSIFELEVRNNHKFLLGKNSVTRKSILLNSSELLNRKFFPKKIRDLYKTNLLTFEDVFTAFPNSYVEVQISAVDSISVSPKFFTKRYYPKDFDVGQFHKGKVDILPVR